MRRERACHGQDGRLLRTTDEPCAYDGRVDLWSGGYRVSASYVAAARTARAVWSSLVARRALGDVSPEAVNAFLMGLPQEHRFALLVDLVEEWGGYGADEALFASLKEVTGL